MARLLEREFAKESFIIRAGSEADQRTEDRFGRLADSATSHPAAALEVSIKENGTGNVLGTASYFVSGDWGASFDFICKKQNGRWIVTQFNMTEVS